MDKYKREELLFDGNWLGVLIYRIWQLSIAVGTIGGFFLGFRLIKYFITGSWH